MKHYSKVFREEALKMSDEIGVTKAAENLGVKYYTLAGWRKDRKIISASPQKPDTGGLTKEQLELKLAEQERTIEILQEAVAFFVNRRKK